MDLADPQQILGHTILHAKQQEAHGPHCSPKKPVQINEYI